MAYNVSDYQKFSLTAILPNIIRMVTLTKIWVKRNFLSLAEPDNPLLGVGTFYVPEFGFG